MTRSSIPTLCFILEGEKRHALSEANRFLEEKDRAFARGRAAGIAYAQAWILRITEDQEKAEVPA